MTLLRLALPLFGVSLVACDFNSEKPNVEDPGNRSNGGAQVLPGHAVQSAERHLPALSGGNLVLVADRYAVIADADRDAVHVVDLENRAPLHHIALEAGDEPGRLAVDPDGKVYVALRRAGAVVVIDPMLGTQLSRFDVCAAPRGLAFESARDRLVVACADGILAYWYRATETLQRTSLDIDLRDVAVLNDGLAVSRFRSAEILFIDAAGDFKQRARPTAGGNSSPAVAWRMIASPNRESVLLLHQLAQDGEVSIQPGGYGSDFGCSVVSSVVTEVGANGDSRGQAGTGTTLAMDISVQANGLFTIVTPAELEGRRPASAGGSIEDLEREGFAELCDFGGGRIRGDGIPGSFVAVAHRQDGSVVRLSQDPPVVQVGGRVISYAPDRMVDTGQKLFHMDAGGGVACASCHPEGGDDGHVWRFQEIGERRSQTIHGGLMGSEPFHWNGDMPTFQHLVSEVFQSRMGGGQMSPEQVATLSRWIDQIPSPPAPRKADEPNVIEGKAIFERADVACSSCHNGPRMGGSGAFDVGTGLVLEVPALVGVAYRGPFLHNGCAPTLMDRFQSPCGGQDRHGKTAHLSEPEIVSLIAYLESL